MYLKNFIDYEKKNEFVNICCFFIWKYVCLNIFIEYFIVFDYILILNVYQVINVKILYLYFIYFDDLQVNKFDLYFFKVKILCDYIWEFCIDLIFIIY